MAKEELLQRLRKRDCSRVFRDRRSTEFTTEFAKRLVACLDKKEDEVGEVRKQEEGDLIEKRMKEKKRSQMEKEGASSSGSQGDRSGRTKKGRRETKEGKEFTVRPRGTMESRRKLFETGKKYVGKMLTVIYQELTEEGKPRFPVGKDIRENY